MFSPSISYVQYLTNDITLKSIHDINNNILSKVIKKNIYSYEILIANELSKFYNIDIDILEYILKKIQGELDAGENVLLDPKYTDYRTVEDSLPQCLTEEYKNKTEEQEKARIEWQTKKKTNNINYHRDKEQYKEWEKINPYPYPLHPMTNDVDMEKAHALLEEHRNGAWNKRTNIEAFVEEFGEEKSIKGPAEYNKMRDEEIRKKDLIQKEKEFIQNNFAFVD
jgi:hypothetical protein